MNQKVWFKKKLIASAVASCALSGLSGTAAAQNDTMMEEVVVTGVRGSLMRAMDIKRDAVGVVDAISSEDIGKFPDTNLAESLQRITGVSISRAHGEGSEVTIRGFGADNNMVTLNGRTMPGGIAYGGGSGAGATRGGGNRAFDFANLASEAVSGIEVYKTGRASIPTGGIGGTLNILTTRPLDNPGVTFSIGGKAVHDTTNRTGDDVTPEVSGIFSWADDNQMFGVSLSASYQERHYGNTGAAVNAWNVRRWGETDEYSYTPDAEIVNPPAEGQLFTRPNDVRYAFSDAQRERTNAQLTLQFAPMDTLRLTADYTYAENYIQEHRGEQTFWFANNTSADYVEFDDSVVATPLIYSDNTDNKDNGYEQQWREQENTLTSIGFNAAWDVTDVWDVSLDVHKSEMESLPAGPGNSGSIDISVANPTQMSQVVDFSGDLPTVQATYSGDGFSLDDFGTQIMRVWYAGQTTDITQIRLDTGFDFDNGRFDFGIESREVEMNQKNSENYMELGNWGVSNPGEIPEGMLEFFNIHGEYDDFDASASTQVGAKASDPVALARWAADEYGYELSYNPNWATNNTIEEEMLGAYAQFSVTGELAGLETNLLVGLRYEETDVTSVSDMQLPRYLLWADNNDFRTIREDTVTPFRTEGSYDNLLPNFDFDISFTDDIKGRFSYSKTIARPSYGNLAASVDNFGTNGSSLLDATPSATQGNPNLVPLESDNVDVSVEWYYGDASYASFGLFEKRVANFVGTDQQELTWFGMQDVTAGPRAEAAIQALQDRGISVDDTSLFSMMAVLDNPDDYPGGADDFQTNEAGTAVDPAWAEDVVAAEYDLVPNSDDPLMTFRTATPVNTEEAKLYGAEFAVQHFFGDTGFGVQANYTLVRGDVGFDDAADPNEAQFALVGLSDTANLVGIYENYGVTARLALNWRDKYLSQTNVNATNNPVYVEARTQLDLNVGYDITDQLSVFMEGINLTGEDHREHQRNVRQLHYLEDQDARYQVGVRYTF